MLGVEHLAEDQCVVTIDRRRLPVLIVTWRGRATDRAVVEYFDRFQNICQEMGRRKFISITDARAATIPAAGTRQLLGQKIAAARSTTEAVHLGSVVIVQSALMRGVLTAVQWAVRGDTRIVAVGDFPSAFDVACGVLRRAEIDPPSDTSIPLYALPRRERR